jgi:hypothetical protein
MTIEELRIEVSKDFNEIDWLKIYQTSKSFYKENAINDGNILSLSKGVLNFVKCNYSYNLDFEDFRKFCPDLIVYGDNVSKLLKLRKEGKFNKDILDNNIVIFYTEKTTVEPNLERHNIPYIKFNYTSSWNDKKPNVWTRPNNEKIRWSKNELVALNRDFKLNKLLK